jgi:transcriptional regulator with XRE-family HTH domain
MRRERKNVMTDYEFTIVAAGLSLDNDDWQERFLDAGCDDALAAIQRGMFALRFDREAASFTQAVESAIRDVEAAGAKVLRIEPDPLVSASDIAERSGLSRQLISLYANGNRGSDFPAPIACATTAKPLWKWCHVAKWLADNDKLDANAVVEAEAIDQINDRIAGAGLFQTSNKTAVGQEPIKRVSSFTDAGYYMQSMAITRKHGKAGIFRTEVGDIPAQGAEFLRPSASLAAACL